MARLHYRPAVATVVQRRERHLGDFRFPSPLTTTAEPCRMDETKLNRWQYITMATLFTGYAGYYICRSNFSVATPLILAEYGDAGIDKAAIGSVASMGVLLYALGKITNGLSADFLGGRLLITRGMTSSVA